MYQDKRIAVIVAAAGSGTRMGSGISKQYAIIGREMVLEKALKAFGEHPLIDDIYLVVKKEDMQFCHQEFVEQRKLPKIRAILAGGDNRQASVYNGLKVMNSLNREDNKAQQDLSPPDLVLVHDGARPFVSGDGISRLVEVAAESGAATLGVPVKDTIARVENYRVKESLDRKSLYSIQTPQGFHFSELLRAHRKARADKHMGTDDAGLVQRQGTLVSLVPGDYNNIKINTREDLRFAQVIPEGETAETAHGMMGWAPKPDCFRMGMGYDVHAFAPNRQLILGGVHIPWEFGLQGHSDADVLTHAIMDALLGACGLGDIGAHFPDDRPQYKDISSLVLLTEVWTAVKAAGYEIGNIDGVVIAQRPKIAPYIKEMKANIATALKIEDTRINIKGTTTEGLGFCGREEGIAVMASAAVYTRTSVPSIQEESHI